MLVGLHVRPNNDYIYISVIIQMIKENEIFIGKNDSKKTWFIYPNHMQEELNTNSKRKVILI